MRSKRKESLIILVLSITLIAVMFLIAVFALSPNRKTGSDLPYPTPILAPTTIPTITPLFIKTRVRFDPSTETRLLNKLKNRQPLSPEDISAKTKILSFLPSNEKSGIVYQSTNLIIDYIEPVDEFQGEIKTKNVSQAKTEAVEWFKAQGMSQKGICDLPLNFYPNLDIGAYIIQQNAVFYSLPDGC